jgi:hypothetical protein
MLHFEGYEHGISVFRSVSVRPVASISGPTREISPENPLICQGVAEVFNGDDFFEMRNEINKRLDSVGGLAGDFWEQEATGS